MAKIVSCEPVGEHQTYDLELDHKDHQFYLDNDVLTSNSHAMGYMILSYQCAWLLTNYPAQWTAAFLDNEPEKKKEKAISIAKEAGYSIGEPDINQSSDKWEVADSGERLLQPLTDIKGLGETGFEQIMEHRPFDSIEDLILKDEIDYRPLNKRVIGRMIRVKACDDLVDDRFENRKHLWLSAAENKPSSENKLEENIQEYKGVEDFTKNEYIETITDLTGVYPLDYVLSDNTLQDLKGHSIPPLGMIEPDDSKYAENICWFIIKNKELRTTRKGNREYWVITVTDITNETYSINIWNASKSDPVHRHRPYMADLDYDPNWGYSMQGIYGNAKMLET